MVRPDLVVLPGPFVPIGSIDDEPSMYRFHRRLASFCRVIRFDHRGIGLSSRVPSMNLLGPKYWAEDAIAVIDAVGCGQVTIFAPSFHAMNGLILAADYPDRVRSLVIINGAARTLWAPDYPVGSETVRTSAFTTVALEPDALEQGFDVLRAVAPSVAGDDAFRTWWIWPATRAGPPSMARAVSRIVIESDVREAPLARQRTDPDLASRRCDVRSRRARPISRRAHRRFALCPSYRAPTRMWVGDTAPLLAEIEEFITGVRDHFDAERVLTTIVFTDIVGSTERAALLGDDRWRDLLDNHDAIVRHELDRFGGREVNTAGDGFVATFTSPSAALACADEIVGAGRVLGIEVRVGVHAGEVEVRGASKSDLKNELAGMAVHIGARVAALAGPSEVLVSSTVRDIVTGSRRTFVERGDYELKGVPDRWRLYALLREQAD